MRIRTDLGQSLVVCCCGCGDELSGCIKIGYFLAGWATVSLSRKITVESANCSQEFLSCYCLSHPRWDEGFPCFMNSICMVGMLWIHISEKGMWRECRDCGMCCLFVKGSSYACVAIWLCGVCLLKAAAMLVWLFGYVVLFGKVKCKLVCVLNYRQWHGDV